MAELQDNATYPQLKTIFMIVVGTIVQDSTKVRELVKINLKKDCSKVPEFKLMRQYELANKYTFTHKVASDCMNKLQSFTKGFDGKRTYNYHTDKDIINSIIPMAFVNLVSDYIAGNITLEEAEPTQSETPKKQSAISVLTKAKPEDSPALSVTIGDVDVTDKIALMKLSKGDIEAIAFDILGINIEATKSKLVTYIVDKATS